MNHEQRERDEMDAKTSALMNHLGVHDPKPHRDWRSFYGVSLASVAQESAMARGEPRPDPAVAIASEMRAWRSLGTTDFSALLENAAGKTLQQGHAEAPVVHPFLTRPGSVQNFHPAGRVGISQFDIEKVGENATVNRPTLSDRLAYVSVDNYSAIISVSRELMEGDDPGAFVRMAREFGRAYALKKEYVFLDALTSAAGAGPTMAEDGLSLFNTATHANLASSGAAPTVATVGAAFAAIRTRPDPVTLKAQNSTPRFLLVPGALEPQARVLAASWNTTLGDADGDLKVLVSGYLDSKSATRWYLFADALKFDTWEMSYLDGAAEPYLETKKSFTTDAIEMRVSHDFGVSPLQWRTQYADPG